MAIQSLEFVTLFSYKYKPAIIFKDPKIDLLLLSDKNFVSTLFPPSVKIKKGPEQQKVCQRASRYHLASLRVHIGLERYSSTAQTIMKWGILMEEW